MWPQIIASKRRKGLFPNQNQDTSGQSWGLVLVVNLRSGVTGNRLFRMFGVIFIWLIEVKDPTTADGTAPYDGKLDFMKEEINWNKHSLTTFCFLIVDSTWPATSSSGPSQLLRHDRLYLIIKSKISHSPLGCFYPSVLSQQLKKVTKKGFLFILSTATSLATRTVSGI